MCNYYYARDFNETLEEFDKKNKDSQNKGMIFR
jgi:hypothetical protein